MKRISLAERTATTSRAWIPYPVAEIDDHVAYVALYKDGAQALYASGNKFHAHEGDQLLVVLDGTVTFEDRAGVRITASKGDAVLVPRGEFHRASSPGGAHVLHVQSKAVTTAFKEEFDRGPEIVAG
ncbi:MAG TPA: cupin domain-containing protein [Planctomycetota bacterium]|nr:cupin domain-containing protein [Planctomycetota bacterium]